MRAEDCTGGGSGEEADGMRKSSVIGAAPEELFGRVHYKQMPPNVARKSDYSLDAGKAAMQNLFPDELEIADLFPGLGRE